MVTISSINTLFCQVAKQMSFFFNLSTSGNDKLLIYQTELFILELERSVFLQIQSIVYIWIRSLQKGQ